MLGINSVKRKIPTEMNVVSVLNVDGKQRIWSFSHLFFCYSNAHAIVCNSN